MRDFGGEILEGTGGSSCESSRHRVCKDLKKKSAKPPLTSVTNPPLNRSYLPAPQTVNTSSFKLIVQGRSNEHSLKYSPAVKSPFMSKQHEKSQ